MVRYRLSKVHIGFKKVYWTITFAFYHIPQEIIEHPTFYDIRNRVAIRKASLCLGVSPDR